MNPVHDRGSMDPVHMKVVHMDPVQSGGPWTPGRPPWSMFCPHPNNSGN